MSAIIKNQTHQINKGDATRQSSSQTRIYSTPEQTTGSSSLSGAATTATYVSTTEKVIKKDTTGIGREYVRNTLENSVKDDLIKGSSLIGTAVTETEKAIARTTTSDGQAFVDQKFGRKNKAKGFIRLATGYAYNDMVNAASQGGKEGNIGDRTTGQSIKYLVRVPRYTKNVAGVALGTGKNLRYASKLLNDVKSELLTGKEAGLALLKRGGVSLKGASLATMKTFGKTAEDFYGSDDLGVEAVRKPMNAIIATNRTLNVTSRAAMSLVQTPKRLKRSLRSMQKTAQKAQQAAKYVATALKVNLKVLSNPIVLKSLAIAGAIFAVIIVLIAVVSSVSALFSSFTYPANDTELTDAYAYVTELDTDLAQEIKDIPSDLRWAMIDEFHINAFAPLTDPLPIISYLSVRYEDFKFNEVKEEIDDLHSALYQLTYHQWTETIDHGDTTEHIEHLDVDLDYKPFQVYVNLHKADMFPKTDDYAMYETYNRIGGTSLRTELGSPFVGEKVYISSRFGYRLDPISDEKSFHAGIDIPRAAGTPINATMSGTVTTGYDGDGYGNYIVITSGNRETLYGHCSSLLVSNGQIVSRGQEIATVGSTGKSTGNHLHFEFEKNGQPLNPLFFIEAEQFISGINGGLAGAALGDEQFVALITEAEKYLGYPYVFGGKTPETSFDCSGFVSWVLTHSGVKQISASAQGLYNNCTPITETELKPGDLVFFQGTYDCPDIVSHVGFYVGNGMMLDCGDPIQYESFKTSYWQTHFYAYGRINN